MNIFGKKFKCEQCKLKFSKYEDLISHARHEHHHVIVKCMECGKEFIHEEDRLHHSRKEHEEKMARRSHKSEHKHEDKSPSTQDDVDAHTRNFGDNF
jgi:DNA-directed RNA polymerase subunit RPC12/RpoP